MNLNDVINKVKEFYPNEAIDIAEALELLLDSINSMIIEINNSSGQAYKERDFLKIKLLTELAENINQYEVQLQAIKDSLEIENLEISVDETDEIDENADKRTIPNYDDYLVDNKIQHTLYESFTHKKPYAFEINGVRFNVRTWQEMILCTCEYLTKKNCSIFSKFVEDPKMNGKRTKYFSLSGEGMRKPEKVKGGNVFIETNMSANGRRNLIIKMLQRYNMKANEYKVYFRADYTSLHE